MIRHSSLQLTNVTIRIKGHEIHPQFLIIQSLVISSGPVQNDRHKEVTGAWKIKFDHYDNIKIFLALHNFWPLKVLCLKKDDGDSSSDYTLKFYELT